MRGGLNLCLIRRCLHFYQIDKTAEFGSVYCELVKKSDINTSETRRIDPGHQAVQVLASSSIFEACESRENIAFPCWRLGEIVPAGWEGKEVEGKCFELGHSEQGIRECVGGKVPGPWNFIEPKIYKTLRRQKQLRE